MAKNYLCRGINQLIRYLHLNVLMDDFGHFGVALLVASKTWTSYRAVGVFLSLSNYNQLLAAPPLDLEVGK